MSFPAKDPTVSVIIPTTALASRRPVIFRAIDSVLDQTGVSAIPTVIINGPGRDPALTEELVADRRLRVHVVETGSLPNALRVGRYAVDTPYFGELDDDDQLMPGALASRVQALIESDDYDCVVSNGYRRYEGRDTLNIPDIDAVTRNPLDSFWDGNWLLPGSYLCRTDRIAAEVFDDIPGHLECSYLALRLATSYRIKFLESPTVIWNQDTPGSASKSREWILSLAAAHERLLSLDLPASSHRKLLERITSQLHSVSDLYLHEGDWREAWRWHMRSLFRRGGHRYMPYTGRLLWKTLAQRAQRR
jgi:glycosyltransferase involved in cell wall biosynthesis